MKGKYKSKNKLISTHRHDTLQVHCVLRHNKEVTFYVTFTPTVSLKTFPLYLCVKQGAVFTLAMLYGIYL